MAQANRSARPLGDGTRSGAPGNPRPGVPNGRAGSERGAPAPQGDPADLTALVRGAVAGDEDAFRGLYRALQPALLRYLRVLVGADAEDVASETWLQVARDIATFSGDGDGFRAWAVTVARHRAMDHLRWLRRRPGADAGEEVLIGLAAPDDTMAAAAEAMSTAAAVAMIARLPQDQAEAVMLRVVLGLDAPAAAKVLGKRAGAVRVAAHRGLRRLAAMLADPVADPSVPPAPAAGVPAPPAGSGAAPVAGPRDGGAVRRVTPVRAPALKDMR